jgi:hypothetical protein
MMACMPKKKVAKKSAPEGFSKLPRMSGYEVIESVPKSSYRDTSMVVIVPSRDEWLHRRFIEHLNAIQWPMNGRRALFHIQGAEVGKAYTEQIQGVLGHPDLSKWKYVLTLEDDVLVPSDCVLRLCEAIEAGPYDGVSGMYFTKSPDLPMPMAYGSPDEYARTGVLDFRPRDVTDALKSGGIMPVNGIACGCSLYRMQLFKDMPAPWFVTNPSNTQDLYFCANARRAGKTFAVDCRVRAGHMDFATGTVY